MMMSSLLESAIHENEIISRKEGLQNLRSKERIRRRICSYNQVQKRMMRRRATRKDHSEILVIERLHEFDSGWLVGGRYKASIALI